jgi:hypothetical protein
MTVAPMDERSAGPALCVFQNLWAVLPSGRSAVIGWHQLHIAVTACRDRVVGLQWHDADDHVTGSDSLDYLRLDWFTIADMPLENARRRFGIVPKSPAALAAGSVGPWEPGGISPFQLDAGRRAANADRHEYDAYGASLA